MCSYIGCSRRFLFIFINSIGLIDTELDLLGIYRAISALAFEIALIVMRNRTKDASATALNTGNSQPWTQLE